MESRTANTVLTFIDHHIGASDAVEMGKAVDQVMQTDGWRQVMEFAERMEDDTLKALDLGPQEHEVYLYNHGFARGIRAAQDIAEAIVEAGKRADVQLAAMNAARENGDV